MPEFVAKALKKHREDIVLDISHSLVCCVSTGEPLSVETFTQRFNRLLKRAGMAKSLRYHDLRHSAAAILTLAGANPKEVSDYLGHSSIGITMDLYADIFDKSKQETARKIDRLLHP